jgi:hypothetical protein
LRWLLSLPVVCLFSQLALADCAEEARAARDRVMASGPLHFQSEMWNKNFRRRSCGSLDPGRAQYDRNCEGDAAAGREEIRIEKNSWNNDGLGWQGPFLSMWTHQGKVPESVFPFQFSKVSCLGEHDIDGRAAIKYEFVIRNYGRLHVETLFTDPSSGMPFRYEKRAEESEGINVVSTYRHDSTIRIEPPAVDPEKRRATSMQRFFEASAQSDPACRREVIAIIRQGLAASFRYEIEGTFWAGVSGMKGMFVPPNSVHNRIEGVPYHGGGSESIAIGDDVWVKSQSEPWKFDPRYRIGAVASTLMPSPNLIGSVNCVGMTVIGGQDYLVYEYDLYLDWDGARMRDGLRRVLVNPATRLPMRIEHATRIGQQVETRQYQEGLRIEPPVVPPSEAIPPARPPDVPFDEFRRRLFRE